MKKILLLLLISTSLLSCKKDRQCWHCTIYNYNGTVMRTDDYCGPEGKKFQDDQGNDLDSQCLKK